MSPFQEKNELHALVENPENWVLPYKISSSIMTDDGIEFKLIFIVALCETFEMK